MNPRVKKIISVKPFVITALWSDNQMRMIDFGVFLAEYFQKEDTVFFKILQPETFSKAKSDGRTIYWDNVTEMLDYDGKPIPAPLDFDPDVLFDLSQLV
ncbi:hypothetical protein [Dyadobacter sp. Leaf189]|uniref:hypothetical protein n=1 Tax=Dyadobacter sp. Leaf189 TaxID=1736295 RepID=UPI0006FAC68C|nr:hypothetical protein [Dyadobacter sp. Leaf189]KQS25503.1 hypothetical protein ASG33_22680 [Dyadobacter sp. Leaf189]